MTKSKLILTGLMFLTQLSLVASPALAVKVVDMRSETVTPETEPTQGVKFLDNRKAAEEREYAEVVVSDLTANERQALYELRQTTS